MGLFDKVKKKENAEVQEQPVAEQIENSQAVVAENVNQSAVAEVSVDNNPFVEEVTPVEETSSNPTENVPSFDNIFNATPGDLVMPVEVPESETQTAQTSPAPVLQVPEFEEDTKEDAITQLVSETVNSSVAPVVEEQPSTAQVTAAEQASDNSVANENPVPQPESPAPVVEEPVPSEGASVEETPVVENPIEQPTQSEEQIVISPVEDSIPLLDTPDLEPLPEIIDNFESLENENIEMPSEVQTVAPVTEPTVESPLPEVETAPVVENSEVVELTPNAPENVEIQEQVATSDLPTVEVVENQVQPEPVAVEENTVIPASESAINEVVPTSEEVVLPIQEETVHVTPVENIPSIPEETPAVENVELPAESVPGNGELPVESAEENIVLPDSEQPEAQPEEVPVTIENNENVEIQDISFSENFIPEEIAASQNSNIIELTPAPVETEEQSVMELSNEPMNYETDIASLAPTEDTIETSAEESPSSDPAEENTSSQEEVAPVIEDIQDKEIVIPELENQTPVVEETTNEDYYNNVEVTPVIEENSSNDSDNGITPIIVEESNDIVIQSEEENASSETPIVSEEQEPEESEIKPVIEEEEPTLNLGENQPEEQTIEESPVEESKEEAEENVVVIETTQQDIQPKADNTEEEPVIVLENNLPTEEPVEPPVVDQEENVSEESDAEEQQNIEDVVAPEFDFQAFMTPQSEEADDPNVENPTVVEAQLDTATYISEPTTTKFCSNCGVMLTDDSSICPSCGEPID